MYDEPRMRAQLNRQRNEERADVGQCALQKLAEAAVAGCTAARHALARRLEATHEMWIPGGAHAERSGIALRIGSDVTRVAPHGNPASPTHPGRRMDDGNELVSWLAA